MEREATSFQPVEVWPIDHKVWVKLPIQMLILKGKPKEIKTEK